MAGSVPFAAECVEEAVSLFEDFMKPCVLISRSVQSDGEGGTVSDWTADAEFMAAIVIDQSSEAVIAMKSTGQSRYTVTTDKTIRLQYHDVIRCESDGRTFRITSDSNDRETPMRATFQFRQVTAEEWRVPV